MMADISGDMQIIISDEVVKEALQHYFDTHEVPLYIADASIQSVGFMLSVDFKWKQQNRQPKSMADLKQMFKPKIVQPQYEQEELAKNTLYNQVAQQQLSPEKMASVYDMLSQLEESQ